MSKPGVINPRSHAPASSPFTLGTDALAREQTPGIDISVCIVNWNCRDLLRGCLESLRRQIRSIRWEVIVVDNGSTDGAADMVEQNFPEVTFVRNSTNLGFSRANNQAARLAGGRYLFFLNNDTVLPPGALEDLVDYADAHPGIGILGPCLRDALGRIQISYRQNLTVAALLHRTMLFRWTGFFRRSYLRCRRQCFDSDVPRQVEVLMGAAMLLPRQVFADSGMWDEEYVFGGEDMDLCYRVGSRWPVVYHPGIEILHYGRAATRRHVHFAATKIPSGFVRYLRKTKTPSMKLLFYKCVATIDAPMLLLANGIQFLFRKSFGKAEKARKSLLAFKSSWHFLLHGLLEFWKS
jgi:N-acetylglucosaminyl-diphospho-decaprenol L-rhamnosyltransferase